MTHRRDPIMRMLVLLAVLGAACGSASLYEQALDSCDLDLHLDALTEIARQAADEELSYREGTERVLNLRAKRESCPEAARNAPPLDHGVPATVRAADTTGTADLDHAALVAQEGQVRA